MAYAFNVGSVPANGALAMYAIIATLMTAGWSKVADSDGTTYSAAGTQITSGATNANGLANVSAWVRLKAPGTSGGAIAGQTRELTFQCQGIGTYRSWRIKYSASAGFVGGSPNATQTPSAADEIIGYGAGTDAAPTYSVIEGDGLSRLHCVCGGAAEFYSFYCFMVTTGTKNNGWGIALDVMAAGSFPASDPDPAVFYIPSWSGVGTPFGSAAVFATTGQTSTDNANPCFARAWLGPTTVANNNKNVTLWPYGANFGSNGAGSNPFTGNDDLLPGWWMRGGATTAPIGLKGCSTLFQYGSVNRAPLDTLDVVSPKDKIFVGMNGQAVSLWAPWNGSVPPV